MESPRPALRWSWLLLIPVALALVLVGIRLARHNVMREAVDDADSLLTEVLLRPFLAVGKLSISPLFVIEISLFLLVLVLVSRAVDELLRTRVLSRTAMDAGQRYAFARFAGYAVFVVGLVVGIQSTGVNLSTLTVFGGALGIGIGFGLQNLAKNFVSGLILLAERPVKVGDRVEVAELNGDVMRIGARSTWVRTNDNVVIIIPNSHFTENQVTNWTAYERKVRFHLPVGVAYSSDPDRVREILLNTASAHPDVLSAPPPEVVLLGFGESALDFELWVWTETKVQLPQILRSDLNFRIFRAFAEHGIEMPFPQRDLHIRSSDVSWPPTGKQG